MKVPEPSRNRWTEWVLRRQHGKEEVRHTSESEFLRSVRDRVLDNAGISGGETLLDVGAGDGLISFGALERMEKGRVILSDVSQDLLDHCRDLAGETGMLDRCRFVWASADDMGMLGNGSVDVVTTRSVLIYVKDKRQAFKEFHRVLKPGGRLSIFEPINRFGYPEPPGVFLGYDVALVEDLARKVRSVYERIQPPDTDPMLDFDERYLFDLAMDAGFAEVRLDYEAEVKLGNPPEWGAGRDAWDNLLNSAGNPNIPTLKEAMAKALTPEQTRQFAAHLRPLVEQGRRREVTAVAYLRATKKSTQGEPA